LIEETPPSLNTPEFLVFPFLVCKFEEEVFYTGGVG
jgi:hypothetical protein